MCLIISKEAGIPLPKDFNEYLNYGYSKNNDGLGLMYWKKGSDKVVIEKSFKKLKQLKEYIKVNIVDDDVLVVHFRKASSGKINFESRHPFPVVDDKNLLKTCNLETDMAMAHNGIISVCETNKKLSDTIVLIKEILADPIVKDNIYNNSVIQKLVSEYIGSSRIVFLRKDGVLLYFGNWTAENQIKFSNYDYKPLPKTKNQLLPQTSYDDYDYLYSKYRLGLTTWGKCMNCKSAGLIENISGRWLCKTCSLQNKSFVSLRCGLCEKETSTLYYYEDSKLCENCYKMFKNQRGV